MITICPECKQHFCVTLHDHDHEAARRDTIPCSPCWGKWSDEQKAKYVVATAGLLKRTVGQVSEGGSDG